MPNKSASILFLGGSFSFGEGLDDNETLSYFIQTRTGRATLNAGLHGYGAHQALRIIEDEDLFRKRTKGHEIKTIVYRVVLDHIHRTAGYSAWDPYGPCYELTSTNNVSYQGSFAECDKKVGRFLIKLEKILMSTSEPFTKQVFKRLLFLYRHTIYLPKDVKRFVTVASKMNAIARSKGIEFFIVLEDAGTYDFLCGRKVPFAPELARKLEQQQLNLILTSKVYVKEVCKSNQLTISKYNRHPTMIANKLLAEYIVKSNLIQQGKSIK